MPGSTEAVFICQMTKINDNGTKEANKTYHLALLEDEVKGLYIVIIRSAQRQRFNKSDRSWKP